MAWEEKEKRKRHALIWAGTSIGCSVVFGVVFGGIFHVSGGENTFAEDFLLATKFFFMWFFAFPLVSAALLIFTNMPEDYTTGFGAAMYYGTVLIAGLGEKWYHIGTHDALIIGAFIMTLCCSVVWFGYFKPEIEARKRMDEKYRDED